MLPQGILCLGALLIRGSDANLPLSHGQRSLWFVNKLAPESAPAYTLVFAAGLESVADSSALERAVRTVIERHPILRSTFVEVDGEPLQRIAARRDFALSITDARGWSAAEL